MRQEPESYTKNSKIYSNFNGGYWTNLIQSFPQTGKAVNKMIRFRRIGTLEWYSGIAEEDGTNCKSCRISLLNFQFSVWLHSDRFGISLHYADRSFREKLKSWNCYGPSPEMVEVFEWEIKKNFLIDKRGDRETSAHLGYRLRKFELFFYGDQDANE